MEVGIACGVSHPARMWVLLSSLWSTGASAGSSTVRKGDHGSPQRSMVLEAVCHKKSEPELVEVRWHSKAMWTLSKHRSLWKSRLSNACIPSSS
jgi:hypothetical protein